MRGHPAGAVDLRDRPAGGQVDSGPVGPGVRALPAVPDARGRRCRFCAMRRGRAGNLSDTPARNRAPRPAGWGKLGAGQGDGDAGRPAARAHFAQERVDEEGTLGRRRGRRAARPPCPTGRTPGARTRTTPTGSAGSGSSRSTSSPGSTRTGRCSATAPTTARVREHAHPEAVARVLHPGRPEPVEQRAGHLRLGPPGPGRRVRPAGRPARRRAPPAVHQAPPRSTTTRTPSRPGTLPELDDPGDSRRGRAAFHARDSSRPRPAGWPGPERGAPSQYPLCGAAHRERPGVHGQDQKRAHS